MSPRIIPLLVVIGLGFSAAPSAAAQCPKGQFYRVSKKTCVAKEDAARLGIYHGAGVEKKTAKEAAAKEEAPAKEKATGRGKAPAKVAGPRPAPETMEEAPRESPVDVTPQAEEAPPPAKAELAPPVAHMPAFSPYGALR